MGIKIELKGTNKTPATLRLLNTICSYLFEQQYGEMKYFTEPQKKVTKYVYRIEIVNHIPPQAGLDFDYDGYFKRWVEEFKNPVIEDYIVTDELLKPNEVLVHGTFGYIFKVGSLAATFEEVK